MLIDHFGREITYLRISVTDRCNFRCVYCMPAEGVRSLTHQAIMRYEEIVEVVRAGAKQGVTSVRLTGGEPLVRLDLPDLVRMIKAIPEITDISLTTNGILLERFAAPLAEAGLDRVNISLDTLNKEKFARITRGGSLDALWRGVDAAEKAGLTPLKFNTVVMRGINDDEILNLAALSLAHPWTMRFIELMPVKNQSSWGSDFPPSDDIYFSVHEMRSLFEPYGLKPVEKESGNGPAREFRLPGAMGKIGFISPLGDHFCGSCNRLRLTADGYLRPCLLTDYEIPLLPALREGKDILPEILDAVKNKPESHELLMNHLPEMRCMGQIGG